LTVPLNTGILNAAVYSL